MSVQPPLPRLPRGARSSLGHAAPLVIGRDPINLTGLVNSGGGLGADGEKSPALLFSAAFRPSRSTSGIQRPSSHLEAAPSAPLMVLWDDIPEALIPPSGGSPVPPDAALRHTTRVLHPPRHGMRGKPAGLEGVKETGCFQIEIFVFSRVS
ncbi:hypothetical protein E2C01_046303 [Portunus trituberculatus]|uniref:Uncharacterized protein n=1 Tax=Portunus trituberculatus TaxID=210409 RepID=A0A5B7G7E4_PORTR|nr:hypothetical protein [Portunus trituberculatus]